MGAVSFSIDLGLVNALKRVLPLDVFVETGTFRGDTVELVKDCFLEIHTVELSPEYYEAARSRFKGQAKIDLVHGDSAVVLAAWAAGLHDKSVLYFFDAHWCMAGNTAGETSQCPLLNEILGIGRLNAESLIVIDDARLFLAPPPAPHEISQWPSFSEVLEALRATSPTHRVMVLNDTIVFFPPVAGSALLEYAQHAGTDWLDVMSKILDYDNLRIQFDGAIQQLEEKERMIQELETAYENAQALLEQFRSEIQQQGNELSHLLGASEAELKAKEAVIQELQIAYENAQALLEQSGNVIQQQGNELSHLLGASEAKLEAKEDVIQELKVAYENAQAQLEQFRSEIQQLGNELSLCKQSLEASETKVEAVAAQFGERDKTIQALTDSCLFSGLNGSTHTHQALVKSLEEKESVIQELAKALDAYRAAFQLFDYLLRPVNRIKVAVAGTKNRLRAVVTPRMGNLNQHAPRPMTLPKHYEKAIILSDTPKISIVTPSFKQAGYIGRTIDSLLGQNYPNLEYFIQDGGSPDGTVEILNSYGNRITGWESKPDGGQSQAINLGFTRTTGEIMAWLNSDDVLLPGAIHTIVEYFNRHPEVDVVYGNRLLIDENDQKIGRWIMPGHDGDVLSWADYVPQETLFWRRSLWEKVGGIDESFRFAMDWDMLVRFRDAGARFAHIPRFLGAFRIHAHQKTSTAISEIGFQEMARIRERIHGRVPNGTEIRKAIMPFLARHVAADMAYRIKIRISNKYYWSIA